MSMNFNLKRYRTPVFIETGTGQGDGVEKAIRSHFKKIYSIELSQKRYEICSRRFKTEIQKGIVELFLGDSVNCLADILKQLDSKATFWLDSHWSGPKTDTAKGDVDVSLMQELDMISKHRIKTHTILIDDVRLFGKNDDADWSNINLNVVIEAIKRINPNYMISYEDGFVPNDVLVARIPGFSWRRWILRNLKGII